MSLRKENRRSALAMSMVPKATLGRLPAYLGYLKQLESETVSATSISRALGFGEVQVRKDLGAVSGEGRPRVGYVTSELIFSIEHCLGSGNIKKAVLVGAGKLGRALLDYSGFSEYGIEIAAAFDRDAGLWQTSSSGKPIYSMDSLQNICTLEDIRIGIITVPKESAQEVASLLIKCGITAIWCFAPCRLRVPKNVSVRYEDLALSLAHLCRQD